MKKRKFMILLSILLMIFSPFFVNAIEKGEKFEKGELRCPLKLDSKTSCKEIKDSNNNVIQVDLIYEENGIVVTKSVKKTNTLGTYDVSFNVKGNGVLQKPVSGDVYIVVVLDMSKTMNNKKNFDSMKKAVTEFSKTILSKIPNAQIALVQFATRAVVVREFKNEIVSEKNICNYNTKCNNVKLKTTSQLGYGLAKANSLFDGKNIPSNAKKYIVLFGDGRYWYPKDTFWSKNQTWSKNNLTGVDRNEDIKYLGNNYVTFQKDHIVANNISIYGIRYQGGSRDDSYNTKYTKVTYCKKNKEWEKMFADIKFKNYGEADDAHMKCIVGNNYYAADEASEFTSKFLEVASNITNDPTIDKTTISSELVDNIGPSFSLVNSSNKFFKDDLGSFDQNGKTVGPFSIEIDPYSETGWHVTNSSFSINYTNENGESKKITCNINPEVYWVQQQLKIKSCSGVATSDTIKSGDSDEYGYYEKTCYEGYLKDNKYYNGFSANIKINNLANGVNSFNIGAGLGFPASINVSTNITCQYKFDYEKFNQDYANVVASLNKTKDPKEIASLTKKRDNMNKILDSYIEISLYDLEKYQDRFTKQSAMLRVEYDKSNEIDTLPFINNGNPIANLNCQDKQVLTINNKNVVVNRNCTLSISKEMELENSCLDMQTGEKTSCNDSTTQIIGGNKFYTNLKEKSGKIYVDFLNAGYSSSLNIKTEDCSYNSGELKLIYRSINLNDPFNQNYGKREIGKNYLNNRYNFVNIIKNDIWSKNYAYQYTMSKTNIDNIKNDTNEDGLNSYLGKECYFNSSNKYVCEFTRSGTDGYEARDFFSEVKINQ